MAQEYVGGGSKKLPTYTKPAPVAPRKPLPSSNPRPATPPKKSTPAPKKPSTPAPKAVPKSVPASGKKPAPAKPAPAPKVPMGKYADIYKDTHKNVPKTTPKPAPAKPSPAKPAPAKPTTSKPSSGGSGYKTVPAPTSKTTTPSKPAAPSKTATPAKPTPAKPTAPKIDPETAKSQKRLEDLWNQANGYKSQLDTLMGEDWKYDPATDASYQALQELAKKNAEGASLSAMEDMNDRGIFNSTVTSDRLGQIQQSAQDAVTRAIPELEQAAYGKRMDKAQQLYNLYNSVYGQAQNERAFQEDGRRWDLEYDFREKTWQSEFDLNKWQAENQQGNWEKEFNWTKTQTEIENSLKDRGLELDHLQYQLNELNTMQKQNGYFDDKATQQALGSALKYQNAAGAAQWLSDNATSLYQSGADLSKIISALDKRFGGFQDAISGGGSGSLFP